MSLVLRHHNTTPNKLVLSSPTQKSNVELSLSSVIDTFDPEARKRLVSSLRRREAEHKKEIERIKEQAKYEVEEALTQMKEELFQAEENHQNTLNQFSRYKENVEDDIAKLNLQREQEAALQEVHIQARVLEKQSEFNHQLDQYQQQAQSDIYDIERKYEDELEALRQELSIKNQQIQDLKLLMDTKIGKLMDENESTISDLKQRFLEEKGRAVEEASQLKLKELMTSLQSEFEETLKLRLGREKEIQERLVMDEKMRAEETIAKVSSVASSRLADFDKEVQLAVEKKTELLERRMQALQDATTKVRQDSNSGGNKKSLIGEGAKGVLTSQFGDDGTSNRVFSNQFIMILIAIVCTWLGTVIGINNP